MTNGSPVTTGSLGPAGVPSYLPQNLGGTTPYITATANSPTASVTLFADNLSGYTLVTVYRIVGATRTAIRAATDVAVAGALSASVQDFEAPLAVSVTYVLNADGVDVATSNAVTLTATDSTFWIKHPSIASYNLQVQVVSVDSVIRSARVLNTVNVLGRSTPIVITDVRQARKGSMVIHTDDAAGQTAVLNLFDNGEALFFQAPPTFGFPDMYFVAGDLEEVWEGGTGTDYTHTWHFPFTEVAQPATQTNITALNSWTLVVNFGSWNNVLNKRATWLDVLNNPWTESDGT